MSRSQEAVLELHTMVPLNSLVIVFGLELVLNLYLWAEASL